MLVNILRRKGTGVWHNILDCQIHSLNFKNTSKSGRKKKKDTGIANHFAGWFYANQPKC